MIGWVYDDGGRKASGRKGSAGDCAVRAIAIGTGRDYDEVYRDLHARQRVTIARRRNPGRYTKGAADPSPRTGVDRKVIHAYLTDAGWSWTPTMTIGSGCKVHLHVGELPKGRIICSVSKHVCAVIDHVIHDTADPSRDGTRCVYGYWAAP
jgi:hypothetical protein